MFRVQRKGKVRKNGKKALVVCVVKPIDSEGGLSRNASLEDMNLYSSRTLNAHHLQFMKNIKDEDDDALLLFAGSSSCLPDQKEFPARLEAVLMPSRTVVSKKLRDNLGSKDAGSIEKIACTDHFFAKSLEDL